MDKVKALFLYILALVVLLAPAILLGWVGWSFFDWWGGIVGVISGMIIFFFSMNKVIAQNAAAEEEPAEMGNHEINSH